MLTGVSYMGSQSPKHLKSDLLEMKALKLDDVLVCTVENDFRHYTGKIEFTPKIAKDLGIRPIAIFWGALNLFGGGRSSNYLLEHPDAFQVGRDGSHRSMGCYVNRGAVARIKEMIDTIATHGFEGYFVDEPAEEKECFCPSCRARYEEVFGGDLTTADIEQQKAFRQRCVVDYVEEISLYCKEKHPQLETMCCLMPHQQELWPRGASVKGLDNLGTDIYWVNNDRDVEGMRPLVRNLDALCKQNGKKHHEWLQCWICKDGSEQRIFDQGKILVEEQPDALYVWAWEAQIGTTESAQNPELSWAKAVEVLRLAKQQ